MSDPHVCSPDNAARFMEWIRGRGGIAVWESINLSNPGASWSTPALTVDGSPTPKPTWQVADNPARVITDPADVVVDRGRVVKTLRIALRMGGQGMSIKLTDASTRKVRAAVNAAGDGAWYEFGGDDGRDCFIMLPGVGVPLLVFLNNGLPIGV